MHFKMDIIDKELVERIMDDQFSEEESLIHLKRLFNKYKSNTGVINYYGLYLVNAGLYKDGINILKLNKKPKSELRVLAEYIANCNLDEVEKALEILFSYLKQNKANLLKDTLIELQESLAFGYLENYKEEIIHYSKINSVLMNAET